MEAKRCRRVVLVSCPFQGHINPLLQLGTILYSKGFSITIVHTQLNSPKASKHPEFDFQAIPEGLSKQDIATGNLVDIILALNERCKIPFQDCLLDMMLKQDSDDEITCVIYDDLMYFSEEVANNLNIPSIILRTSSAASLLSRLAILQLKEEGYIPFPGIHAWTIYSPFFFSFLFSIINHSNGTWM